MSTFKATVVAGSDGAHLQVTGDLDLASADQFLSVASSSADTSAVLALDLSEVTFIDSTGLGALIKVKNNLADRGGSLVLTSVSTAVERVLSLTGLAEVFEVASQAEK